MHAVIKPIYGAASIGVVRVNDVQQLESAYKRVTRELARAHIVAGALQQGDESEEDGQDVDDVVAAAQVRMAYITQSLLGITDQYLHPKCMKYNQGVHQHHDNLIIIRDCLNCKAETQDMDQVMAAAQISITHSVGHP